MKITESLFKTIFPTLSAAKRREYLPILNLAAARFNINTERRVAMWLAQLKHESNGLSRWVENLNYSARRLTEVWRGRFPTLSAAQPYAGNPKALANKVYNGRMGNRVGTNDGWDYRGRCPIQATGREMYERLTDEFGKEFGVDFVKNPDLLLNPLYGILAAACIFAVVKGCNPLADANKIEACTRKINGGVIGLADRKENYERALAIIPDNFFLDSYADMQNDFGYVKKLAFASAANEPDAPDTGNAPEAPEDSELNTTPEPADKNATAGDSTQNSGTSAPIAGGGAGEVGTYVAKDEPSTISKLFAYVTTGLGKIGIGVETLSGRATTLDNATMVRLAIFIGLIVLGLWIFDRAKKRANERTLKKAEIAADPNKVNVQIVPLQTFLKVQETQHQVEAPCDDAPELEPELESEFAPETEFEPENLRRANSLLQKEHQ